MECELVEFHPGDPLPKDVEIRINRAVGSPEVYNALHKSWIKLDPGDYINVSTPGDYYPIKAHIVAASYERI